MSRLEQAARRAPGLFAFGTGTLRRLTAEEEALAPFEERLRSVWAYVVNRSQRSCAALSGRERAHLDSEDLVAEICCELLKKDGKWNPQRGRYITFVEAVARSVIVDERERARVVRAPANARARLEKYRRMHEAGELKPGPRRTMEAIERCLGEVEAIHHAQAAAPEEEDPDSRAARDRELIGALRQIGPVHALVLAAKFGLFDGPTRSPAELARVLPGRPTAREVRGLEARAESALRDRIRRIRGEESIRENV